MIIFDKNKTFTDLPDMMENLEHSRMTELVKLRSDRANILYGAFVASAPVYMETVEKLERFLTNWASTSKVHVKTYGVNHLRNSFTSMKALEEGTIAVARQDDIGVDLAYIAAGIYVPEQGGIDQWMHMAGIFLGDPADKDPHSVYEHNVIYQVKRPMHELLMLGRTVELQRGELNYRLFEFERK